MTTATQPEAPAEGLARPAPPRLGRRREEAIQGRFIPITTQQLALVWWLYREGHISRRQLRIWFAALELHERRRYAPKDASWRPCYHLEEIARLVGGAGSQTALRELASDVKRLAHLGLVTIDKHAIHFARSSQEIRLGEPGLDGFAAFFEALPNRRRTVPVPRRTVRALAAGFSRAVTATMIAALIRSVFWTRARGGGGEYSVDGRTKLSWIAETFGISRRAATNARAHLIELGWLKPIETQQWELNRWGVRDAVNVHWSPANDAALVDNLPQTTGEEGAGAGGSATPSGDSAGGSATPCLNRSSLPSGDSTTRQLGAPPASPSGDCLSSDQEEDPDTPVANKSAPRSTPKLRDIAPQDLRDTQRLLALRDQAVARGFAFAGEGGLLDFLALAHRARARGQRPAALFFDLIKNHRTAFITVADEEAARAQLREYRDGPDPGHRTGGGQYGLPSPERQLSEEERIVEVCLQAAKKHRIEDPFRIAQRGRGWSRDQWDEAYLSYTATQARQWQAAGLDTELEGVYS